MRGAYYKGIRGSAAIGTAPLAADPALAEVEALAPGELRRVPFAGELLGAARVRARFAPLPFDAFDRVAGVLAAEEQAAYLHLLRLSWGEGRNFCRAGKRDLMARLGLSERRLNRVLDALVEKRFARPLHRDNRGTLYRVRLPAEAFGEVLADDVLLGRALAPVAAPLPAPTPAAPPPAAPAPRKPLSIAQLARELVAARGRAPTDEAMEAAASEVTELLEDGHSREQVTACIRVIARRTQQKVAKGA